MSAAAVSDRVSEITDLMSTREKIRWHMLTGRALLEQIVSLHGPRFAIDQSAHVAKRLFKHGKQPNEIGTFQIFQA